MRPSGCARTSCKGGDRRRLGRRQAGSRVQTQDRLVAGLKAGRRAQGDSREDEAGNAGGQARCPRRPGQRLRPPSPAAKPAAPVTRLLLQRRALWLLRQAHHRSAATGECRPPRSGPRQRRIVPAPRQAPPIAGQLRRLASSRSGVAAAPSRQAPAIAAAPPAGPVVARPPIAAAAPPSGSAEARPAASSAAQRLWFARPLPPPPQIAVRPAPTRRSC